MEPRGLGDRLGALVVSLVVIVSALVVDVSGNLVFPVSHKFNGRQGATLSELKSHDDRRHARFLGATQNAVDVVLGGNGHPSENGLYYAKLGIGNPSHDYYVHVDTGSDVFWVMCSECSKDECPTSSEIKGVNITLYDRKSSSTSKVVTCNDNFCDLVNKQERQKSDCKANETCNFKLTYGDGESTSGYYVKDDVQFQKASGNFQTSNSSGSVVFGCTTKKSGAKNNPNSAVSGLIGFGQANSSMLSQLVAAGKARNKFAHCLDNTKQGGGIWAIGEVVEPKIKNTSPIVPNQDHYNVVLEKIEVADDVIELPKSGGGVFDNLFGSSSDQNNMAIFDSGTTLAFLPPELQEQIVKKILAKEPGLELRTSGEFTCFEFSKKVDEIFPIVKFSFKNSASMRVYPHDYLFTLKEDDKWCHGWMKSKPGSKTSIILGDMILSNKVIVYDLEKQVIGWTDHNCSSSIKVKDDQSGSDYSVQYHNLADSDASSLRLTMSFVLLVTAAATAMLQMISI